MNIFSFFFVGYPSMLDQMVANSEEHLRLSGSYLYGRKCIICSSLLLQVRPSDHSYSEEYETTSHPRSPPVVSRTPRSLSQKLANTSGQQSCPLGPSSPSRTVSRLSSCLSNMRLLKVNIPSHHAEMRGSCCSHHGSVSGLGWSLKDQMGAELFVLRMITLSKHSISSIMPYGSK